MKLRIKMSQKFLAIAWASALTMVFVLMLYVQYFSEYLGTYRHSDIQKISFHRNILDEQTRVRHTIVH